MKLVTELLLVEYNASPRL